MKHLILMQILLMKITLNLLNPKLNYYEAMLLRLIILLMVFSEMRVIKIFK